MGAGCSGDYLPTETGSRYASRSEGGSNLPSHGVGSMESARGGPVRATPLSNPARKAVYAAPGSSGNNSSGPPVLDKPSSGSNSRPGSANRMRRAGSGVRLDPLSTKGTPIVASVAQQQQQQPPPPAQQSKSGALPSAVSSVLDHSSRSVGALHPTHSKNTDSTLLYGVEGPVSGQVTPATTNTKNGQLQPLQRTQSQSSNQIKQQQQFGHNNNRAAAHADATLPAPPTAAVAASSSSRSKSQQPQPHQAALPAGLPSILATAADPYAAVAQMHAAQQAQQQQLHIQQLQLQQQQLQLQQLMQQHHLYGPLKQQQPQHNGYAGTPSTSNEVILPGQPPPPQRIKPSHSSSSSSVHGNGGMPPMLPASRSNSAISSRGGHPLSVDVHGGGSVAVIGHSGVGGGGGVGPGPSPSHYLSPLSVPQGSQSHSMAFASRSMTPTSSANGASLNHAHHHMPPFEVAASSNAAAALMQMQLAQQHAHGQPQQAPAQRPPPLLPGAAPGVPPGSNGSPLPPSAIAVSTHMIYHDNNPEYDAYKKQWAAENARETALKRERSKGHGRTFSRSLLATPDRSAAASPTFAGAAAAGAAGGGRFFPGTHIPPHMLRSLASGAVSPLSPGSPPALQGSPPAFGFGSPGVTLLPEDMLTPEVLEPLSPFDIAEGDQVIGSGYLVGERTALAMLVETRSPNSLCVSPVPGFRVMSVSPTPFELLQASPERAGMGPGGTGPRARLRVQNSGGGALSPSGTMTPGLIVSPRAANGISASPLVLGGIPSPSGAGPGGGGGGGAGPGGAGPGGSIDEQLQARQARLILQQQIALAQQAQVLAQAQAQAQAQSQAQAQAHPHPSHVVSPSPPPVPATPPPPASSLADAPHFQAAQLQILQQQLAAQLSATMQAQVQAQAAYSRRHPQTQGQGQAAHAPGGHGHGHHPSFVAAGPVGVPYLGGPGPYGDHSTPPVVGSARGTHSARAPQPQPQPPPPQSLPPVAHQPHKPQPMVPA